MTDREYLELAAKAAGMIIDTHYVDGWASVWTGGKHNSDWIPHWNPLIDDGDAFRLAVQLRLHAKHFSFHEDDFDVKPLGMVEVWQEDGEDPLHIEYFEPGDDRLAATRRGIVRAAAELGRSMT